MDWDSVDVKNRAIPRASETIYETIRDMIIRQDLKPGDILPTEKELVERFGRSRPTVREATRMLDQAGLIRTIPGSKGAVVTIPSIASATEFVTNLLSISGLTRQAHTEYRYVTEPGIMAEAARNRTEEDIKKLYEDLDRLDACGEDRESFLEVLPVFLDDLSASTHNIMMSVMDRVVRGSLPDRFSRVELDKHRRFVKFYRSLCDAIRDGDPERAESLVKERLAGVIEHMKENNL